MSDSITALALAGSALALSNLITAGVLERGTEIGLLKAIGATDLDVLSLVLAEIMITALAGGLAGYGLGLWMSKLLGQLVFGTSISASGAVVPLLAVFVVAVAGLGSLPAVKLLLSLRPTQVLHGR